MVNKLLPPRGAHASGDALRAIASPSFVRAILSASTMKLLLFQIHIE